jgi:hypothetical protein
VAHSPVTAPAAPVVVTSATTTAAPATTSQPSAADALTLERLARELDTYSSQISTQLRTINIGVLGLSWLLLLGRPDVSRVATYVPERALLVVSLACILALLTDLAQYYLAEHTVDRAYDRASASETKTTTFDDASWAYRMQSACYYAKSALTIAAAFMLVGLIVRALF